MRITLLCWYHFRICLQTRAMAGKKQITGKSQGWSSLYLYKSLDHVVCVFQAKSLTKTILLRDNARFIVHVSFLRHAVASSRLIWPCFPWSFAMNAWVKIEKSISVRAHFEAWVKNDYNPVEWTFCLYLISIKHFKDLQGKLAWIGAWLDCSFFQASWLAQMRGHSLWGGMHSDASRR